MRQDTPVARPDGPPRSRSETARRFPPRRRARRTPTFALLALALLGPAVAVDVEPAAAQQTEIVPSDTLRVLTLTDGSTLYGRVVDVQGDRIIFETQSGGRIEIDRSRIRSLELVRGTIVDGEVWSEDRNATRLFFGPTGRGLARGDGYLGVYELFFSFAAYGVSDRFVLAGGTPVLPQMIGRVFYAAPKAVLVERPGLSVAAGALGFFATEALDAGSLGVLYGVATMGDEDTALTAGAGWGYVWSGDVAELSNEPVLMVGGEHRVGSSAKLLTENYIFPSEGGAAVSGGVRLIGDRFSADLGVAALLGGGDSACCLPVVSVMYGF